MVRRKQLLNDIREGRLSELFKTEYENVIHYNMQCDEMINMKTDKLIRANVETSQMREIDNMLMASKALVIIEYVFMSANVDPQFENMLMRWSQNENIYDKNSTVIVLCSDLNLFNETVRRQCFTYTIEPSTAEERRKLLQNLAQDIQKSRKKTLTITEDLIQQSSGLTLHDTETAALEGFTFSAEREFQVSTFTEYKKKILKESGLEYVQPKVSFEHVGGYNMLKGYIRNRIITPLRDPEKANYYGVGLPRGLVMASIPGCGKSLFGEAIACELGLAEIKLGGSDFFRGIVGESESRVKRITNILESLAPVVVMMDELDAIAIKRGLVAMGDSGVQRRITNMLLDWLGRRERKSFLIGATNFIEQLDPAFIRPGIAPTSRRAPVGLMRFAWFSHLTRLLGRRFLSFIPRRCGKCLWTLA